MLSPLTRGRSGAFLLAALLVTTSTAHAGDPPSTPYDPPWAGAQPTSVVQLEWDPLLGPMGNGSALAAAISVLVPGQRLEVGDGVWNVDQIFNVDVSGTETEPIWIVAADGATPIVTRPNAKQNVMNVGVFSAARYLVVRGLEFTGGSMGVRLYTCSNVWFDGNHVHHTGQAALTANTRHTDHLYITRNHIHHTAGTGEGMYLGGNNGSVVMRESVVALNHVHDTGGSQGDGIELKQGSWGNWIAENEVHNTKYPCLLVYGTGGKPRNLIERNVLYRSFDNVLQVQGEAIVQNNLAMAGSASAFHSHDHQGQSRDLWMLHNTFINSGRAANMVDWNNRPGMILANNAFYSQSKEAIRFQKGSKKVLSANNFVLGPVVNDESPNPFAYLPGISLSDFLDADWGAKRRNAQPAPGSPLLNFASPSFPAEADIYGTEREFPASVGAFRRDSYAPHYGYGFSASGDPPSISTSTLPELGASSFAVEISGGPPLSAAVLFIGVEQTEVPVAGGAVLTAPVMLRLALLSSDGDGMVPLPIPDDHDLKNAVVCVQWIALDPAAPEGLAFSDGLLVTLEQ